MDTKELFFKYGNAKVHFRFYHGFVFHFEGWHVDSEGVSEFIQISIGGTPDNIYPLYVYYGDDYKISDFEGYFINSFYVNGICKMI